MQWPAVCSGLMYLVQLALRGQEQRINDYLSDVCMERMQNSECRLELLNHGLLKCLENHSFQIFTHFFAISLGGIILTQMYREPGPLAESGLQELSVLLSLSICRCILNVFVNF